MYHAVIIGGGIVGLAAAYKLLRRFPQVGVTVLEKETVPGLHQTGNNSGVLHCGLYYKPGSFKARLAVSGIKQMVEFCVEHRIPHEICGKIVVATQPEELPRLQSLFERGQQNGLEGIRLLRPEEIREYEPHAAGLAAIHVPQEGIVDYRKVCDALVRCIQTAGSYVIVRAKVESIRQYKNKWLVNTRAGDFEADILINCAGLHSDRVAQIAGESRDVRIVPFRGEYYKLAPSRQHLVRNLIYPVPDPRLPFLGVHFTRQVHGGIEAGPNAVLAFAREGYRWADVSLTDLWDSLSYRGFWKFVKRYPSVCWNEIHQSLSKQLFCRALQKLVPDIQSKDLVAGGSGVRAQALTSDGELVQDFYFITGHNALHVLNAPSPGATASLAIGEEIANRVMNSFQK